MTKMVMALLVWKNFLVITGEIQVSCPRVRQKEWGWDCGSSEFSEALYDKRRHTGTPSLPDMLLCSFSFPCMFQTFPSLSSKYNVIVN